MNKNENMKNACSETAIALADTGFTSRILAPADFKALDALIETLGDKSANLGPDEKASAIAVIDEWNTSVTARIKDNAEQAGNVLAFLESSQIYGTALEDAIELFHGVLGDTPEYLAYRNAVEAYQEIQADAPIAVPVGNDMTVAQADKICMENSAAELAHNRKVKAAEHAFNKAVKAYIKALNAMPEIKSLKDSLRSYRNKASRMATTCQDKATRAKLNVSVSDPDVRKALHEMMDFAKTV